MILADPLEGGGRGGEAETVGKDSREQLRQRQKPEEMGGELDRQAGVFEDAGQVRQPNSGGSGRHPYLPGTTAIETRGR